MAKAVYTSEVTPKLPDVTLYLTGEEAMAVLSLMGKVTGGYNDPHAATKRVYEALTSINELRQAPRWITDPTTLIFTGEKR